MNDASTMDDPDDSLVTRRSRRSTAGNRMEAALAEMASDAIASEAMEEDADFVNDKDEQDEFGSDFESTDEEAAQEDLEAGDRAVQEEERRARKDARSRLEKATAAAHAKNRVTFNPQAHASLPTPKPKDTKRRVSLGIVVNAVTGEILPVDGSSTKKKRHSQRKHTVLNTSATVTRMKESEEKKAATPRKVKTLSKVLSQAELIALALDNEEGNIVEHRDYLKIEEEKRRRARVVRPTVNGPLLRWVSKGEEMKVTVPPPPVPPYISVYPYGLPTAAGSTSYAQSTPFTFSPGVLPLLSSTAYSAALSYTPSEISTPNPSSSSTSTPPPDRSTSQAVLTNGAQLNAVSYVTAAKSISTSSSIPTTYSASQEGPSGVMPVTGLASTAGLTPTTSLFKTLQHQQTRPYNPYLAQLQSGISATPVWSSLQPQPTERIEKVAKNYVIHELSQYEDVSKPPWNETMTAMFGDHVKWDDVKVYVGKSRPLSRPKQMCPITGLQAKYLDPRTGVPYADLKAFKVLTSILKHEYVWSPALKCYVRHEERKEQNEEDTSEDPAAMEL